VGRRLRVDHQVADVGLLVLPRHTRQLGNISVSVDQPDLSCFIGSLAYDMEFQALGREPVLTCFLVIWADREAGHDRLHLAPHARIGNLK